MRALVTTGETAAPMALGEVAEPDPRSDQAVVSVRAISLNRGEVAGLATLKPGARPGWDLAGQVLAAAADGSGPAAGTRVVGLLGRGAWGERVAVPARDLAPLPPDVSFEDASTLPVAGLTALRILRRIGDAGGRSVLVTGGAGGVGRFAIQLAARAGARVTAVVGSPERGRDLADLGADVVSVGFPEDGGFDLIMESAGGASLAAALGAVADGGVVVSFGNSSGEPTTFSARSFYAHHGARLEAFLIFPDVAATPAGPDLENLAGLVAAGDLRTSVAEVAYWRDAGRLARALLARTVAGKAVLLVDQTS